MDKSIIQFKARKYTECINSTTSGLKQEPTHQGLLYLRASALVSIKEYQEALKDVTLLLKSHPTYARGYILASNIFQFLGQSELAKSTLVLGLKKVSKTDKRFTELETKYNHLCHPKPTIGVTIIKDALPSHNFGEWFLPLELVNRILFYLPFHTCLILSRVSRFWKESILHCYHLFRNLDLEPFHSKFDNVAFAYIMHYSKDSLQTLSLSHCTLISNLKPLVYHRCRNLTRLNLSRTRIKDTLLIDFIEKCGKCLIEVRLCSTRISNTIVKKILDYCRKCKVLDLTECLLLTSEAFLICDKFKAASLSLALDTLVLNHTELGDDVLRLVIPVAPSLSCIGIVKCKRITNTTLRRLISCSHLNSISFEGTNLSANGFSELFLEFVSNCKELRHLELPGMSFVNDTILEYISTFCPSIESLNLKMCANITSAGLGYFDSLKMLNVSYCHRLVDSSLFTLMRNLESLDVSFIPNLTDNLLECIKREGQHLRIFKISGNPKISSFQVGKLRDKMGVEFEVLELNQCQGVTRQTIQNLKLKFPNCRFSFVFS